MAFRLDSSAGSKTSDWLTLVKPLEAWGKVTGTSIAEGLAGAGWGRLKKNNHQTKMIIKTRAITAAIIMIIFRLLIGKSN